MSTANTLTNLFPDLYEALDVVSREQVGFIPAVNLDASLQRAALNQNIRSFVTPSATSANIVPGLYAPDDGNQSIGNIALTISNSKYSPIRFNGEEQRELNSDGAGPGYMNIRRDQIAQSMRNLCNQVELSVAGLYTGASRASGSYNTQPFASTLLDPANCRKILNDNGAPMEDRHMIIDSTAGSKMLQLTQLTNVNQSGDQGLLRQGILQNLMGFNIRESKQVYQAVTVGSLGSSPTVNSSAYAVGATVLTITGGTGSILAGDIITLASDSNQYVVSVGTANASSGTITLANPGLQVAIAASASPAITLIAATNRNMFFSRNAIALAVRAPFIPIEGDMSDDAVMVQDPRSGISFDLRMYKQYRQVKYELGLAWGCAVVKPEHLGVLIG